MVSLRRSATVVLALFLFAGALLGDLRSDIEKILSDRLLAKATTGIEVVRLTDDPGACQVLYEKNARKPLVPASNMKLLTTSAALHVLTPQFRFRTMLVRHGDDLVVWGDGDPTIGDAELMDQIGWTQTAVFEDWANQLKARQITTVRDIIIDDSIFDDEFLHPRWAKHQFTPSGAELGGLNFGANTIEFTVSSRKGAAGWSTRPATAFVQIGSNTCVSGKSNSVILARPSASNEFSLRGTVAGTSIFSSTIHDPGLYSGTVLRETLASHGISITGALKRDRETRQQHAAADPLTRDQDWQILCVFETPLSAVVTRCNKESMNLYAEALSKRMGAAVLSSGTWEGGATVVGRYLTKLGVAEAEFRLDDGSGLSRDNRVSPNALIRSLLHNYYSPNRALFVDSLPVGGVDGTLHKRFDGNLRGRVFAKTGFIANVSALTGYLKARNGEWYAFSILMNDIPDLSNSSIKPLQEKIVQAIDDAAAGE